MKPHEHVILEISRERERQMADEGWTPEHDDRHQRREIALAAMGYVQASTLTNPGPHLPAPKYWPWERSWWKPKDHRRNLIRAAALLVAEIERLDRAASKVGG